MASSSTVDGALLLLVTALLPLRLLSFVLRLHRSPSRRRSDTIRSLVTLAAVAAFLSANHAVSDIEAPARKDVFVSEVEEMRRAMESEIEALKLKIDRLESVFEERTKALNSKIDLFEENNKLIEAMEHDIQSLINEQNDIKKSLSSSYPRDSIKAMEDEVRLLKDETRMVNSNLQNLQSKANDADKKLEALNSEVSKIENIVTEQWLQVRQFEQAFQLTKMMASKVHKRSKPKEWSSIDWPTKFIKGIQLQYIPDVSLPDSFFLGGSFSKSCHQLHNLFEGIKSAAQKYHHQVHQASINAMESNKYTAALANDFTALYLAYMIMISPLWIAWMLSSICFGK